MPMEKISQGAEAMIFRDKDIIIKKRVEKEYRLREIDSALRRARTRREAKVMQKLPAAIARPGFISCDDKGMEIRMGFVPGSKVRDVLEGNLWLAEEIGKIAALMHNANIVHGDLTTSNMIYNPTEKKIYLIDFGLSSFSHKDEDKAVDLHLLKQALESKHYTIWEKAFALAIKGYEASSEKPKDILERLEIVESRGRNKERY
jgi:TP53 regulating kinase and related kinases